MNIFYHISDPQTLHFYKFTNLYIIIQSKYNIFVHRKMINKIQNIKADIKQARNSAYLGKYQQSQKLFKGVIDTIQQQIMLNNIPRTQIQLWRQFQSNIIQQKNSVQALISMISGLGTNASYVQYNNKPRQMYNHSQSGDFDQAPRRTNTNFRTSTRPGGFSVNKSNSKPFKDPDVWDPPPPVDKRTNQPYKKPARNVSQNYNGGGGGRNKPNMPHINKKGVDPNGKKSFLYQRYPDGNGPDTNLIETLERQVMDKSPNVTFDDIAELETAKGLLQQAVLLPLKMPQFFTGIRRAWKGVLMFGPPGTGKTLLAKAVASSGGTTFFNVSASSLASKWKGQSQKLVRILFQMAKFYAPAVIFFDEIDALGSKRKDGQDQSNRKVKTELLVQMDGATASQNQQNKFVIVLAATNRPWDLDQALRRRLQKRIYIPLPTEKGRKELVRINLKNVKMDEGLNLDFVVQKTQGFSGADITNVCRQAAYMPMRRKLKKAGGFKNIQDMKKFEQQVNVPLTKQDFLEALKNVNKSVGKQDLKKYQAWMNQFGTV